MFNPYRIIAKNSKNDRIKNLLYEPGINWKDLFDGRKIVNYPNFFNELDEWATKIYGSSGFSFGTAESPLPNTRLVQKSDFPRHLLEKITQIISDEEERMKKYQKILYLIDKVDKDDILKALRSYSEDTNPQDAYDPSRYKKTKKEAIFEPFDEGEQGTIELISYDHTAYVGKKRILTDPAKVFRDMKEKKERYSSRPSKYFKRDKTLGSDTRSYYDKVQELIDHNKPIDPYNRRVKLLEPIKYPNLENISQLPASRIAMPRNPFSIDKLNEIQGKLNEIQRRYNIPRKTSQASAPISQNNQATTKCRPTPRPTPEEIRQMYYDQTRSSEYNKCYVNR